MHSVSYEPELKKAPYYAEATKGKPKSVFVAASVMLFFLSLSAADSIGFVPYYVDGSTPFDSAQDEPLTTGGSSPRELALANLPELGEEIVQETVNPEGQQVAYGAGSE